MGAARSECLAARFHHRHPEKPARRIRSHSLRSSLEKETRGRFRRWWNPHPDHPQSHRPARSLRGRHCLPDSFPALPPGYRRPPRRTWPPPRKGKFPDHPKPQALPHPVSQAWAIHLTPQPCGPRITAATPNSFIETKKKVGQWGLPVTVRTLLPNVQRLIRNLSSCLPAAGGSASDKDERRTSTSNVCLIPVRRHFANNPNSRLLAIALDYRSSPGSIPSFFAWFSRSSMFASNCFFFA